MRYSTGIGLPVKPARTRSAAPPARGGKNKVEAKIFPPASSKQASDAKLALWQSGKPTFLARGVPQIGWNSGKEQGVQTPKILAPPLPFYTGTLPGFARGRHVFHRKLPSDFTKPPTFETMKHKMRPIMALPVQSKRRSFGAAQESKTSAVRPRAPISGLARGRHNFSAPERTKDVDFSRVHTQTSKRDDELTLVTIPHAQKNGGTWSTMRREVQRNPGWPATAHTGSTA